MATVIRQAVVQIGLQQIPTELKAPDISVILDSQRRIEESVAKVKAGIKLRYEDESQQIARIKQELSAEGAQRSQLAEQATVNGLKVFQSLQKTGEGAFLAARGFALLGTSGNDDLRAVIQTIAQFQGAFDIFKGSGQVVFGVASAYRQLTVATNVATAAQWRLNAAQSASPAGIVLLAVAVAATAAAAAYSSMRDESESAYDVATRKANETADAISRQTGLLRDQLSVIKQFEGSAIEGGRSRLSALQGVDTSLLQQSLREAQEREKAVRGVRSFAQAERMGLVETTGWVSDLSVTRPAVLEATEQAVQRQLQLQTALSDKTQSEIEQRKAIQQAVQDQLKAQSELIQGRQRELEVANNILDAERQKVQSIEAQLGALSRGEQNELRRLAEKASAGQLTARQAERFGQLGGDLTRDSAQGQLANLGREFADELGKILGKDFRSDEAKAAGIVGQRQRELQEATGGGDAEPTLARIESSRKRAHDLAEQVNQEWAEYGNAQLRIIRQLQNKLFEVEREQRAVLNANLVH